MSVLNESPEQELHTVEQPDIRQQTGKDTPLRTMVNPYSHWLGLSEHRFEVALSFLLFPFCSFDRLVYGASADSEFVCDLLNGHGLGIV